MAGFGIGKKLIIAFLLVGLVPALTVGYLSFLTSKSILQKSGEDKVNGLAGLEAIADLKVEEIETFFEGIRSDAEAIRHSYIVRANFPILNQHAENRQHPDYVNAKRQLDAPLRSLRAAKGFIDVLLLNLNSTIVYSTEFHHPPKDVGKKLPGPGREIAVNAKDGVYLSNVFASKVSGVDFEMLVAAPVQDFNQELVGVIVLAIDLDPVYEFIQRTTGLGATGETLLGQHSSSIPGTRLNLGSQYVLFLNPLRHDPNAALNRKVFLNSEAALPIQEAVQGREGSGISIDYREKNVVAAWRHIPSLDWGFVAKIDEKEAFSRLEKIKLWAGLTALVFALFVMIAAVTISHTLTEPIVQLRNAANEMGKGHLDFKLKIKSKDELYDLAEAFKQMAVKVRGSKEELEKQVKLRTKELRMKIEELEKFNRLTVGREVRMAELKKKIKKLESKKSKPGQTSVKNTK